MPANKIKSVLTHPSFKYIMDGKAGPVTNINGKDYIYFGGAGYFKLQSHPEVIKASIDALMHYGITSATSRTITGTTRLILELEQKIADYFGTEDAAYLPSGYLSNIAGLQALEKIDLFDAVFIDENAHYCNLEGALLSKKPVIKFKHRDTKDLKAKISSFCKNGEKPLIATDGLFPIWATLAPLDEYLAFADEFDGIIWIDDSHGVGIIDKTGKGTIEYFGLKSKRIYMGATLSKAFGAYGGFVTGDAAFINQVKCGNVMTGSSSPPSASVAAAVKGIEIVKNNPKMRQKLWNNSSYLKKAIANLGIEVVDNYLPVVTFTHIGNKNMEEIHKALLDKGIYIQYVKYKGSGSNGVLRIVLNSSHTERHINQLISSLKEVI